MNTTLQNNLNLSNYLQVLTTNLKKYQCYRKGGGENGLTPCVVET